jgi:hypothetical protein
MCGSYMTLSRQATLFFIATRVMVKRDKGCILGACKVLPHHMAGSALTLICLGKVQQTSLVLNLHYFKK